jgi:hypothetical protein
MNDITKQRFIKNIGDINAQIESDQKEIDEQQAHINQVRVHLNSLIAEKQGLVDDIAQEDLSDIAGKSTVEAITAHILVENEIIVTKVEDVLK